MRLFFVLILYVIFLSLFSPAYAEKSGYPEVTSDPALINALDIMDGKTSEWAKKAILGNNVSGLPVKVMFKNLSEISPQYTDFDALGWKSGKQLYIYLNNKHKNAPPEALASLLSHEAVHQDTECSLEEETYAWGYEADVWIQMKKNNPQLKNIPEDTCPLVKRLNTLEKLFREANYTIVKIRNLVYSNPGYKGLPEHSPGF
jgi:hypothetical protein